MRRLLSGLTALAAAAVLTTSASGPGAAAPSAPLDAHQPAIRAAAVGDLRMVTLINDVRVRHGLRPVRYSERLSAHARPWARMLATSAWKGRLAHDPGYWSDIRSSCRSAAMGSENVAARTGRGRSRPSLVERRAAKRLLRQYLHSPPHRANILNPVATHVGVATMLRRTPGGAVYVANVLRFARARSC